eukprot:m.41267 g.41267  ORF g.41267 m.41267 type:complete len:55 (-) comp10537_c0_seq2:990-1154(-)
MRGSLVYVSIYEEPQMRRRAAVCASWSTLNAAVRHDAAWVLAAVAALTGVGMHL